MSASLVEKTSNQNLEHYAEGKTTPESNPLHSGEKSRLGVILFI
jgi:hypothetical protein